jgi:hypothetical protein
MRQCTIGLRGKPGNIETETGGSETAHLGTRIAIILSARKTPTVRVFRPGCAAPIGHCDQKPVSPAGQANGGRGCSANGDPGVGWDRVVRWRSAKHRLPAGCAGWLVYLRPRSARAKRRPPLLQQAAAGAESTSLTRGELEEIRAGRLSSSVLRESPSLTRATHPTPRAPACLATPGSLCEVACPLALDLWRTRSSGAASRFSNFA